MKEDGVSSIVAAVLIFSMFSTAFLLWTLNTMPEWVADREKEHQDDARQALSNLEASLERLSDADESGPATVTVPLAAKPIPLLQARGNLGNLGLSGDYEFDATFTNPRLFAVDQQGVGAPNGALPATLADVDQARLLELALSSAGVSGAGSHVTVTATATDTNGATATFSLSHQGSVAGCGTAAGIQATVSGSVGSSRTTVILCQVSSASSFTVDALSSSYGFRGALGQLETPYDIAIATSSNAASDAGSTAGALWIDEFGNGRALGSGVSSPGFTKDAKGTSITFDSGAQRFTSQELFVEGGGILVSQPDGVTVTRAPGFTFTQQGNQGFLRWTVATFDGTGSASGTGSSTISVTHDGTQSVFLQADGATFTMKSEAADGWRKFFEDQTQLAGLTTTDAQVGGTGNTVTFTLSSPTITTWSIDLRIIHATVTIG